MKCPNCGHELGVRYQPKKERDEELKRLYHEELWTPEQLSKKYEVGAYRIKQIIGFENLRRDKELQQLARRIHIYNDREGGMTYVAVGKKYGICAQRARDIYRREKRLIEWRKRREAQK